MLETLKTEEVSKEEVDVFVEVIREEDEEEEEEDEEEEEEEREEVICDFFLLKLWYHENEWVLIYTKMSSPTVIYIAYETGCYKR